MKTAPDPSQVRVDTHDERERGSPLGTDHRVLVCSIADKLQTIMNLSYDEGLLQSNSQEQEHTEIDTIIMRHINTVLAHEPESSFIERPMERDCRVAVMIPAYNESHQNILRSLSSLAGQEKVSISAFEVDIIVNNSRRDAEEKTAEFLANQQSLKLIHYINGKVDQIPEGLTEEQSEQIKIIR